MKGWLACLGPGAVAIVLAVAAADAGADDRGLKLSERSAVPGQVVIASGLHTTAKAKVRIGGKKARVVSKRRGRIGFEVPRLKPGRATVVVRTDGDRLSRKLKIKRGFSGKVKPAVEPFAAVSAEVGPGGGVVTARAGDGTAYELTVPAGALAATETITLTPVTSLGGMPGGRDALAVQFSPEGLRFASPAALRITGPKLPKRAVGLAYERWRSTSAGARPIWTSPATSIGRS